MDVPAVTLDSGFSLPAFGFGTWKMGGGTERDPANDDARDVAAIRRAVDAGVRHIDTAELYAAGHAEELVAQALDGVSRSAVFLASKVMPGNLRHDDVLRAAEGSLRRLKTDYLDLYLIHHANPDIPLEETLRALDSLVDDGRVRAIGVSNFAVERLRRARALARHPIVCNQVHLNLAVREADVSGLSAYCRDNDVLLVAWRPVQNVAGDPPAILRDMAEKYGKTPVQVAINWVLARTKTAVIVKTTHAERLEENLGALGWSLTPEDAERLTREYPDQAAVSPNVALR